jgi:hypothetical protein
VQYREANHHGYNGERRNRNNIIILENYPLQHNIILQAREQWYQHFLKARRAVQASVLQSFFLSGPEYRLSYHDLTLSVKGLARGYPFIPTTDKVYYCQKYFFYRSVGFLTVNSETGVVFYRLNITNPIMITTAPQICFLVSLSRNSQNEKEATNNNVKGNSATAAFKGTSLKAYRFNKVTNASKKYALSTYQFTYNLQASLPARLAPIFINTWPTAVRRTPSSAAR